MDRKTLERHVEQSERHSAAGWRIVARQMDVLVGLVLEGEDASAARRLMITLEDLQEAHEVHRDWLKSRLRKASAGH